MTSGVLLDNDVMLKTCCYALVDDVLNCLGQIGAIAVLGTARFVLASRINRTHAIADKEATRDALARMLAAVGTVEPDDVEIAVAAELEAEALARNVALDSGESLLVAILLKRGTALMMTGDKRAIVAINVIAANSGHGPRAAGRIGCLEQLFMALLTCCDAHELYERVCREPSADKALSVCFSCHSGAFARENTIEGLVSYIKAIRAQAPTVVVPTDDLSAVIA